MSRSVINKTAIQCLEEWLDSYLNFEKLPKKGIFWLDTIKFLCQRFNNPQQSFKSIHIAGSKGKGSVSSMLSSIIKEYKGNCGLYTSPHILSLAERITNSHILLDEQIYEESLKELITKVESIIPEQLPNEREITWFELVTLYSFLCFRKSNFSWAVYETGLGGRLDSTNILEPELSIITPIELEHTEFLGNTISEIAFEKAGIIKSKVPICISKQSKEALEVILEKAQEVNSPVYYIEDYIENLSYVFPSKENNTKKMEVTIKFKQLFSRPINAKLSLIGKVQAENACLACLCAKILFPEIPEEIIEKGLNNCRLQGRFEIEKNPLNKNTEIIYDGAHTVKSIKGTLDSYKKIFHIENHKGILIFAVAADKDIEHIAKEIIESNLFRKVYITKPGSVKQSDISKVVETFQDFSKNSDIKIIHSEDYSTLIEAALKSTKDENTPLLITGSFYLVAEAKKVSEAIQSNSSSFSE